MSAHLLHVHPHETLKLHMCCKRAGRDATSGPDRTAATLCAETAGLVAAGELIASRPADAA